MAKYEELKKEIELAENLIKIEELMNDRNYFLVKENNIFLHEMKKQGLVVIRSHTQCHWSDLGAEKYKEYLM